MVILGLDPGLQNTGWGVIAAVNNNLKHVAHGVIHTTTEDPFTVRLRTLLTGLQSVIATYQPQTAAVEETFVNTNPQSTLKLGMARGVVMLAPALANLPVGEYSANKVKKAIVGQGHATKDQVAHMVRVMLPKAGAVTKDAADALAVAICHAHYMDSAQKGYALMGATC